MELSIIKELCIKENENKVISDSLLSRFFQKTTDELRSLIKTFTGSLTSSTSDDQPYQDLLRWRDSGGTNKRTYKELCKCLDEYSIFAGRNVLVSYGIIIF